MGNCLDRRTASPCEEKAIHFTVIYPEAEIYCSWQEGSQKIDYIIFIIHSHNRYLLNTNYVLVVVVVVLGIQRRTRQDPCSCEIDILVQRNRKQIKRQIKFHGVICIK